MSKTKQLVCPVCKTEFEGKPNQIYCCKKCNTRAKTIRNRRNGNGSTVSKWDPRLTAGCKGCVYRANIGVCDYIGYHGQCRPCVPYEGGGCDVYTTKQAEPVRTWDEQKARELWARVSRPERVSYNALPRERMEELTRKVAKKLGCAPNSIKAWLNKGGDRGMAYKVTTKMLAQIRQMHGQGMTDSAIADVVGLAQTTVLHYRRDVLGLPKNKQTWRRERLKKYIAYNKHTDELVAEGTAREIADKLGLAASTVRSAVTTTRNGHSLSKYEIVEVTDDE